MSRTLMTSMDPSHPTGTTSAGDSVMFSLSALLAKEAAAAPLASTTGSRATQDGSGLIDLSALAGGPIEVPTHVPVLPFGLPPAPPVVTELALAPTPTPRVTPVRTWTIAAFAVAAVSSLAAALLLAPRAEPGPPAAVGLATATSALAAQLPPVEPPPALEPPPPAPVVRAEDSVHTGRDSAFAGPSGRPAPNRLPPANRTPGDRPKDPRLTREPPKAPPQADPCRGDLLCAMRRATQ